MILKSSVENSVYDCSVILFQKIESERGHITPVQGGVEIPFNISRVFYLYDIPGGEDRGAHAHKECHQLLVAASGAFDVVIDDGRMKKMFTLNRPNVGLYIPPGIWASEQGFSSGAICLVIASHDYSEADYIREYEGFIKYKEV